MCSSCGYKSLPFLLAFITLLDMILGLIRINIFFSSKPARDPQYFFEVVTFNSSYEIQSPLMISKQANAAFAIDWIASIVPTFMGIYVALFMLVAACSVFVTCVCLRDACSKNKDVDHEGCSDCCRLMCSMCTNKANHRCVTLTWNCPCYKARPRLRFHVRLILMLFFIVLRILAIILYASDKNTRIYGAYMAFVCSISVVLLFLVVAIDLYQYRVWWYYRPDGAYKKCRCCCCKQHFHPSHERFLPQPLAGVNRDVDTLGDQPCEYTMSDECPNRSLEHIAIFHAFDYKPQRRFQSTIDTMYIGFHQTTSAAAVSISRTAFHISSKPPQMLGFGVYFARSFAGTKRKARGTGAFICAEVDMRRVRIISASEINEVSDTNRWWEHYDTIYYAHDDENLDEFCVKSPDQILKWIMVMNDDRLRRCGLDHEFDNTYCGCI